MVNSLQGWGGIVIEAVNREEGLWSDGLFTGGDVLVEGGHLVFYLDNEVIRHDAAVMQVIVDLTVRCDTKDFHGDRIVTVKCLSDGA